MHQIMPVLGESEYSYMKNEYIFKIKLNFLVCKNILSKYSV